MIATGIKFRETTLFGCRSEVRDGIPQRKMWEDGSRSTLNGSEKLNRFVEQRAFHTRDTSPTHPCLLRSDLLGTRIPLCDTMISSGRYSWFAVSLWAKLASRISSNRIKLAEANRRKQVLRRIGDYNLQVPFLPPRAHSRFI